MVLRTAVRPIMGEYLYEHHCDALIDKFRRLEMEGMWNEHRVPKLKESFPYLVIITSFRIFIPNMFP